MPNNFWQSTGYVIGGPDTPYPMVSVNAVPSSINVGVYYNALTFRENLTFPTDTQPLGTIPPYPYPYYPYPVPKLVLDTENDGSMGNMIIDPDYPFIAYAWAGPTPPCIPSSPRMPATCCGRSRT